MRDDDARVDARLAVYSAYLAAFERRGELSDAIWAAVDAEAAVRAVATLLGVGDEAARAVVDLQWRRLSAADRARIREQHDALVTLRTR